MADESKAFILGLKQEIAVAEVSSAKPANAQHRRADRQADMLQSPKKDTWTDRQTDREGDRRAVIETITKMYGM